MPEEVGEAVVRRETREIDIERTMIDRKFFLALAMIIAFGIMLVIPVLTNNVALFKDVAATLSGFIGTIIGCYFGSSQE